MQRRDLLKLIASATGMAMIGMPGAVFGYAQAPQSPGNAFSAAEVAKLDEIAEIIIPRTNTPGAKDAGVGLFMAQYVTDCYTAEQQTTFRAGLADIDARAGAGGFIALTPAARVELLNTLDAEAKARAAAAASATVSDAEDFAATESMGSKEPHYFTMFKQLVLFSFFTSETGATQVLRYVAVPGYYDGDVAYEPGTPAWAT